MKVDLEDPPFLTPELKAKADLVIERARKVVRRADTLQSITTRILGTGDKHAKTFGTEFKELLLSSIECAEELSREARRQGLDR